MLTKLHQLIATRRNAGKPLNTMLQSRVFSTGNQNDDKPKAVKSALFKKKKRHEIKDIDAPLDSRLGLQKRYREQKEEAKHGMQAAQNLDDDQELDDDEDESDLELGEPTIDELHPWQIEAVNNPLFEKLRYYNEDDVDSDAEYISDDDYIEEESKIYEEITPEKVREWRNDVHGTIVMTKQQLNQYKHRQELLNAIDERLKDDPEGRAYFDSKLMMSKTPYNRVLRKNMHKDGSRAGAEYEKWLSRMARDDQAEDHKVVIDSRSTKAGKKFWERGMYEPANELDMLQFQRDRKILNHLQYTQLKQAEMDKQIEERDITIGDEYEVPLTQLEQQIKEMVPSDDEDINAMRDEEDLEDENFMRRHQLHDKGFEDEIYNKRETIREEYGSVYGTPGWIFDTPAMDLKRDVQYEKAARIRDGPYYDTDALERTIEHAHIMGHKDRERLMGAAMMTPDHPFATDQWENPWIEKVEEEYHQVKQLSVENISLRNDITDSFRSCRNLYKEIMQDKQDLGQLIANKYRWSQTTMHNKKDFSGKLKKASSLQSLNKAKQALAAHDFDPKSTDLKHYETELRLITDLAMHKDELLATTLHKFEFVFDCMKRNLVKPSTNVKSRLFEYACLNSHADLANKMLKELASESCTEPINTAVLEEYFNQCLKKDNFSGIAYLTHYCETHKVKSIAEWNLSNFRQALNYYSNVNFNTSKVMIFNKFYTNYYKQKQAQVLKAVKGHILSDEDVEMASQAVFARHEALVDMRGMFKFLAKEVGQDQMVDPLTKKDALWELVELFTKDPQFHAISQKSKNNGLDTADIAEYLGYQLNGPRALERVFKISDRLEYSAAESSAFTEAMMRELKAFQAKYNESLPYSFNKQNIKKLYLKKRASNSLEKNSPSAELLLFVMKTAGLNEEVIDMCTVADEMTPIKRYYLSEALMQMDLHSGAQYTAVLQQAKVLPEGPMDKVEQLSVSELVQATKAQFLDNGALTASKFFEKHHFQLSKENKLRENMLVAMYDSAFKDKKGVDIKTFKKSYMRSTQLASKVIQEAYSVRMLSQVLDRKEYNEIEAVFSYYTTLKEERDLIRRQPGFVGAGKKAEYEEKLGQIQARRKALGHDLSEKDRTKLNNLVKVLKDQGLDMVVEQKDGMIQAYMNLFKDMEYDQIEAFRRREEVLSKPKVNLKVKGEIPTEVTAEDREEAEWHTSDDEYDSEDDNLDPYVTLNKLDEVMPQGVEYDTTKPEEQTAVLHDFRKLFQDYVLDFAKKRGDKFTKPSEETIENFENIMVDIEKMRRMDLKVTADMPMEANMHRVAEWRASWEETDPAHGDDLDDPEVLTTFAYNETLVSMKEHLLSAVTNRRKDFLPIALQIFNKIQNKNYKFHKIDDYERAVDEADPIIENVNENLAKIHYILDDPRSPIVSTLVESEKYEHQWLIPDNFGDYYKHIEDTEKPIDIDLYYRDQSKMKNAKKELEELHKTLMAAKFKVFEEKCNLESGKPEFRQKDMVFFKKYKQHQYDLYQQFKKNADNDAESFADVPRQEKIKFMRNVLALHLGEQYTQSQIPDFYAYDLIAFGVRHKQAEAIRLGEKILAEQGGRVPADLATSVRNFLLNGQNQKRYRQGITSTGPLNTTKLYQHQSKEVANPIYCMDDPYWQDFMAKNCRREDIYKTPSIYAWDHKPYGIVGEVIDFDKLRQNYQKYSEL